MGSDSSKTQVQVQNKDYDPDKRFRDKREGQPLFHKRATPDKVNQGQHQGHTQDQRVGRNSFDLDQVSVTTSDRLEIAR